MDKKIPHGVIQIDRQATDYVRGVNSQIIPVVNIPSGDWRPYYPSFERQSYKFDTNECTQLSGVNVCETQCNWLRANSKFSQEALDFFQNNGYFDSNGSFAFSERFTAIDSGTDINGGSPWWFWQTVSKHGLLPRADLNYTFAQSEAFDSGEAMCIDYYNPLAITQAMRDKAIQSLQYLSFQYEWLGSSFDAVTPLSQMQSAIQQAPLHIGVPVCPDVWTQSNLNLTVVPFCGLREADHCITNGYIEPTSQFDILDHYVPFVKALASGYFVPQAILGVVTAVNNPPIAPQSLTADANNTTLTPQESNYFILTLKWILATLSSLLSNKSVMPVQKSLGILGSSTNPAQLSATVSGIIIGASSLIILFANSVLHLSVTNAQVVSDAGMIGAAAASIYTLYGLIRKIVIAFQQRFFPAK